MEERWQSLIEKTLDAQDYRSFLLQAFEAFSTPKSKFNYTAFSRKAGFTSRSFVKEVVAGKKRITSRSYPGFIKALALPFYLRNYFQLLVVKEEHDLNFDGWSEAEIESRLDETRERLRSRLTEPESEKKHGELIFHNKAVSEIYALIGHRKAGISFERLVEQSGLQPAGVKRVLEALSNRGIIAEKDHHFTALKPLHVEQGVSEKHPFRDTYLSMLEVAREQAKAEFASPENLFMHAIFTVDRRRMPELKGRLRELIKEFVEDNIDEEGNSTSKLIVGLFK